MATATVRIPTDKRDALRLIARVERAEFTDILNDLIDEYIERHQETLDLLSRPDWVELIQRASRKSPTACGGSRLPSWRIDRPRHVPAEGPR